MLDRSTNLFATNAAPDEATAPPVTGDGAPLFGQAPATLLVEPPVTREQPTDEVPALAPTFATTVSAEQAEPAQEDGREAPVERPVRARTPRRRPRPRSQTKRSSKHRGSRARSSGLATGAFGKWIKVAGGSFVGFVVLLIALALIGGSHGKGTQTASAKPAARAARAHVRGKQKPRRTTPDSVGGELQPAHEGSRRPSGGPRKAARPRADRRARPRRPGARAIAAPSARSRTHQTASTPANATAPAAASPTGPVPQVPPTPRRPRRVPAPSAPAKRDAEFGIEG